MPAIQCQAVMTGASRPRAMSEGSRSPAAARRLHQA